MWQVRWSIGFELFDALKQFEFKKNPSNFNYPLNYCIGHGLFFTEKIFYDLGGFNEDMHNEDAIFGLELSYNREKIYPIPYFDLADTPNSLKGLHRQKSSWYVGPFHSFKYYRQIVRKKNIVALKERARLLLLTLKLFNHAIYWIAGPSFLVISFLICITEQSIVLLLLFVSEVILFLALPNDHKTFLS